MTMMKGYDHSLQSCVDTCNNDPECVAVTWGFEDEQHAWCARWNDIDNRQQVISDATRLSYVKRPDTPGVTFFTSTSFTGSGLRLLKDDMRDLGPSPGIKSIIVEPGAELTVFYWMPATDEEWLSALPEAEHFSAGKYDEYMIDRIISHMHYVKVTGPTQIGTSNICPYWDKYGGESITTHTCFCSSGNKADYKRVVWRDQTGFSWYCCEDLDACGGYDNGSFSPTIPAPP